MVILAAIAIYAEAFVRSSVTFGERGRVRETYIDPASEIVGVNENRSRHAAEC
jgi:hypothetical protein